MGMYKLLLIFILFAGSAFGQTPLHKLTRKAAGGPGCSLLFNSYGGAATGLSLRKLDCSYSGSCIRVRRSSDNAEQDIGFSGNVLDQAAMEAFVGTGGSDDGFVVAWYDQSGNGNSAFQATSTKQPKIMDNGVTLLMNGLPTMLFDGTDDFLSISEFIIDAYLSLYLVLHASNSAKPMFTEHSLDVGVIPGFFFYGSSNSSWYVKRPAGSEFAFGVSNWLSSVTGEGLALADLQYNGAGAYYADNVVQSNGAVSGSAVPNVSATDDLYIFSRAGSAIFTEGYLSEYILYDSDQTANRSSIVTNINTFYTIF
jgi:hypothetical protein